jgi:aspartyl-tRNA(Asn)/glutamyl-tRNA(Gln) amidotransferase subunit A
MHWLAAGRTDGAALEAAYRSAIARDNAALHAFLTLDESAAQQAAASDARRREGRTIGRLDSLCVAIKDNIDVAGLPTTAGLATRRAHLAQADASAVALRAAGATILGKTNLDEGALGTSSANPHFGTVRNPWRREFGAGGSSGGSAAAVAAGLCSFALGSDTLGSVRIPASHCGVFALKPTHGEISARSRACGASSRLRRHPCARGRGSRDRLAGTGRARSGRPAFAPPPRTAANAGLGTGPSRTAFVRDLGGLGVSDDVRAVFEHAVAQLAAPLGQRVEVDFSDHDLARTRRAALLLMEAELGAEFAHDDREAMSPRCAACSTTPRASRPSTTRPPIACSTRPCSRRARVFAGIDVLVLPTVAKGPQASSVEERANDADLTSFASLAVPP